MTISSSSYSLLQWMSYATLCTWQLGSKVLSARMCVKARGAALLVELLTTTIAATLRTVNAFYPGFVPAVVTFQLYGVVFHLLTMLPLIAIGGWRRRRPRAIGLMLFFHLPPIAFLAVFSGLIGFYPGPYPVIALFLTATIAVLIAMASLVFGKHGMCPG